MNIETRNKVEEHLRGVMKRILDKRTIQEPFNEDEVKIIASIARYHRGSDPDESKHKIYTELTEEQKKTVCQLASILRIADGMDKPHKNLILRMEAKETEFSIDIYIKTVGFKPKLKMAEEKSALFSSVFKKNVQFLFM